MYKDTPGVGLDGISGAKSIIVIHDWDGFMYQYHVGADNWAFIRFPLRISMLNQERRSR
ncbi:hypothetical protein MMJ09_05205 [Bacillus vallismortis]|nr:hypothetical protein [Bacillus vallismortis]